MFKHVTWCITNNIHITFTRQKQILKQINVIDINSPDAQLLADMLEHGYSIERACDEINRIHVYDDMHLVTLSCVYGCLQRLSPLITPVKKRKQGSINPEDPWARKNWVTQLLVRLGILKFTDDNTHLCISTYTRCQL